MPERVFNDETLDILCNERVRLIQKKKGYRFSMDPLLLANFVKLKKRERLLDVGTGCGIIPIYLSKKGYTNKLVGIEIQNELYALAVRNKELNACANVEFIRGDVKAVAKELGNFQILISNPPYVKQKTGRTSPEQSRVVARYESDLDLSAVVSVASSVLSTGGRLCLIYPAERLGEVVYGAKSAKLEPKRLRLVHSRRNEPAALLLIECVKGGGAGLRVEAPLYIYEDGDYTEEVRGYYM